MDSSGLVLTWDGFVGWRVVLDERSSIGLDGRLGFEEPL